MSLLRATFADARSPVIGGLGQIVPTVGPPPPPEVFGVVVPDIQTLIDQIAESPSSPEFQDGSAYYVTTITYVTDDEGSDPVTTGGWVIITGGVPTPVIMPTLEHYGYWIDVYSPPSGTYSFIDDGAGGTDGFAVNVDGEPVPTTAAGGGGTCSVDLATGDNSDVAFPLVYIGEPDMTVAYNAALLIDTDALATGGNSDVAFPLDRTSNSGMTTNYNAALLPTVGDI